MNIIILDIKINYTNLIDSSERFYYINEILILLMINRLLNSGVIMIGLSNYNTS
jgi:hypothetical protein